MGIAELSEPTQGRDASQYTEASYSIPVEFLDEQISTPVDVLLDMGVPAAVVPRVIEWHRREPRQERIDTMLYCLRLIFSFLYNTGTALETKLAGLSYAIGHESARATSMTKWAKRIGVTTAAISKESYLWKDHCQLRQSPVMKSEAARDSFARRASRVWKKRQKK